MTAEVAAEAAAEVGLGRVCGTAARQLRRSGRQRKRLEVVATATMAVARHRREKWLMAQKQCCMGGGTRS